MDRPADRLPLVIGTTGHRDLRDEDVPVLELAVADVILRLKRDYLEDDAETPIIVLSSLAEGADQLVARVALAHGAQVIAPLPFPADEYRADFAPGLKPGAAAGFDQLLSQAIAAPVMPLAEGNTLDLVRRDQDRRALQYREVGLFIARHCHVLIALWDGELTNIAPGGTAEVVEFNRRGIPPDLTGSARASLDGSEISPVVHIVTPRDRPGGPDKAVAVRPWEPIINSAPKSFPQWFARTAKRSALELLGAAPRDRVSELAPDQVRDLQAWEIFGAVTALTRRFNREAGRLARSPGGPAELAASLGYLFEDPVAQTCVTEARDRALARAPRWCALYQIADTLARQWQSNFRNDWMTLFSLGFLAILAFGAASHVFHLPDDVAKQAWMLIAYGAMFLATFAILGKARYGEHQERFLDYRALAEALRVAIFWKLVGIATRTDSANGGETFTGLAADAYPIKQPNELAWVKISLRALALLDLVDKPPPASGPDRPGHAWTRALWVDGQRRWFGAKGLQHQSSAERRETGSLVLFAVSVVLAVVAAVMLLRYGNLELPGCPAWLGNLDPAWCQSAIWEWLRSHSHGLAILAIGVLPGLAAVIAGYSEQLAFKAQARQYDRMRQLFERAYEVLPASVDDTTAALVHGVYVELGREAMKENAEWTAIYRQRPMRAPQG